MDILDEIAGEVKKTIADGYYEIERKEYVSASLKSKLDGRFAIVTEIKPASPSKGKILEKTVEEVAEEMKKADGVSVLTEPKYFSGSLRNIGVAKEKTGLPVLMKDFIVDTSQIDAGEKAGADVVLLIQSLFDRGYCSLDIDEMIGYAHGKRLEVLLETHTKEEFSKARETDADILGINNRNLGTMKIDVSNTVEILGKEETDKPVISESGIYTAEDVKKVKDAGAKGILVGTSILTSSSISEKIKELKI